MSVTPRIELRLDDGASPLVWTDVSADVLRRDPLRWARGIFDQGPLARLPRPGSFNFTLDNSTANSAGVVGYYSPGHANVRTGFRTGILARLRLTDGANTRYVWRGTVRVIAPDPGLVGLRGVRCMAVDWMALFAETDAADLQLREAVRSDQLIQDLINKVATAPANTNLDVGQDQYPFAFDDLGGTPPKCPEVAQDILLSEHGLLYVRGHTTSGEEVRFENRFARALASVVATFTASDLVFDTDAIEVPSSEDHIFNDVEVHTVNRRTDASATTLLIKLDGPVKVERGQTITMFVDFRDPANEAEYVGGKDMVAPAANTDWTANSAEDGSGTDLTSSFTVTATYSGSRAKIVVTNNHATADGYLRGPTGVAGLQARGRGLYRYAPIASRGVNQPSIDDHGRRQLPHAMLLPYQDDRAIGQDLADYDAHIYGGLGNIPTRLRVLTESGGSLLAHGILRDIGDRIKASEDVTAVDQAEVFINGLEQELDEHGVLRTWWTVVPADTTDLLIFDFGRFDFSAFGWG